MLTLRNSVFSVGTGTVHLLCGEGNAGRVAGAPGRARTGAIDGAGVWCGSGCGWRGGSEELDQLVGDRACGFQRGPVADAGQDLDGGVAVGGGELRADVRGADLVVGAGD